MSSNRLKTYTKVRRPRNESGIALISVLWVLLLLSALAATTLYIARTNAVLTHRTLQIAQAQAAADAAIVDTVAKLSDDQINRRTAANGFSEPDNMQVSVSVAYESGRIDVNTVDDQLLLAFLQSQGLTPDTAAILLDELRDWQDTDSVPRDHGAEIADYQARGLKISPRNGPLESIEELRQIPSWRAQHLDCWMDSLTVYTGLPGINIGKATPKALAALQWAQTHHLGDREWIAADHSTTASAEQSVIGEVLRVRARATVSQEVGATSEWVGRLTGDRIRPMLTMRWDHEPSEAKIAGTNPDVPGC